MITLLETEAYTVKREYTGHYLIAARLSCGASIYLQGEDASQFEDGLQHLWDNQQLTDEQVNSICREYRHLMD